MTAKQKREHKAGNLLRFAFAHRVLWETPSGFRLSTRSQTGRGLFEKFRRTSQKLKNTPTHD
jgi:hypothetical protein